MAGGRRGAHPFDLGVQLGAVDLQLAVAQPAADHRAGMQGRPAAGDVQVTLGAAEHRQAARLQFALQVAEYELEQARALQMRGSPAGGGGEPFVITSPVGGRVLLRIEDHDRQRCRPEYERAILDDLDWLGVVPDEPTTDAFRAGACAGRQSDRHGHYDAALARLGDAVYACDCTRRELRAAMESAGPVDPDAELRYSGRCATRGTSRWCSSTMPRR